MRRLVYLSWFASIVTAFILFVTLLQPISSAREATPDDEATPTGEEIADGVYLDQLWTGEVWEAPGAGTPPPTDPEYAYATKVTLLAGAEAMAQPGHAHGGAFVLTVAKGAICYTSTSASPTTTVVTARVAGDGTVPTDCAQNVTDCFDQDGCTLDPGDTVYLPAGSWISQSDTASHWYKNVGDTWAVLYLTGYGPDSGNAGCMRSCP